MQFFIDAEKCTGCGLCVSDCQRRVIEVQNGKAKMDGPNCFDCGHCFAVCPENAVHSEGLNDEVWEINGRQLFLGENELKAHLKTRRSVRQYKNIPVEKEKIEKIIEAGRLTPTAGNSQNVRYIVLQNDIGAAEDAVISQYKPQEDAPEPPFVALPGSYSQGRLKRGFLFQNAPQAILAISPSEINGHLAAMSMELMAEALGLGTIFVGLFARPANLNKDLRKSLGVKDEELITACLAVGYPSVQYLRTAPKKLASITWK